MLLDHAKSISEPGTDCPACSAPEIPLYLAPIVILSGAKDLALGQERSFAPLRMTAMRQAPPLASAHMDEGMSAGTPLTGQVFLFIIYLVVLNKYQILIIKLALGDR